MATKKRTAGAPAGLEEAKKRTSRRTTPRKPDVEPLGAPTSAAAWKKGKVEGLLVRVPSGNTAKIRTPGMDVFLQNGTIPHALIPLVQQAIKGKEISDEELSEVLGNEAGLDKIISLADDVLVACCIDPVVNPVPMDGQEVIPIGDSRRDEDLLYVDEVDFADKMFIFGVATGGTQSAERFREQSGLDVGIVPER